MEPKLGAKLPLTGELPMWAHERSAGEWAEFVEGLGYDSLWMSEAWGANAFVDLAEVAMRTERLRFGTAIANVYSRSPAVLAMAGASLARLSGGRAVLGLGASHPGVVEGLHDLEYDRPVRRTHETIEAIRALTGDAESVGYEGELFDIETEGFPGLEEPVPVYNAALGEANRRATGRVADGWLPYLLPFSRLEEAFETVAAAAREAGRDPDDLEVIPQVLAVVDEDADAARRPIREYLADYINYEAYRNVIAERFPEETAAVVDAREAGDEAAVDAVTDEMVHEFGVAGPPEAAREQLREVLEIGAVDAGIVYVPNGASVETYEETFAELGPRQF